mgnify:CR=1 FL=1
MLPAALGHSRLYVPMLNPPIAAWGPVNVAASARRLITPAGREKLERQTFKAAPADQRGWAGQAWITLFLYSFANVYKNLTKSVYTQW